MNNNQRSSADHIVEHLSAIEVDGETMQYIIDNLGLSNQMLRQLMIDADDSDVNKIIEERNSLHDRGKNTHFDIESKPVEDAKQTLEQAGYFTKNLWHVDDVKYHFKCSDEEAQDILNDALTNDATMEQVWFSIKTFAVTKSLTEIKEKEEE